MREGNPVRKLRGEMMVAYTRKVGAREVEVAGPWRDGEGVANSVC